MPSKISNRETEGILRRLLESEGFRPLNAPRKNGETGCDMIMQKGKKEFHIEIIGYKSAGSARAKDFFEVFFRAVSRIKDGARHCVIALPK